MIIVIGSPLFLPGSADRPSAAAGLPVTIAAAAADLDHEVQLVGRVGEDPAGDATLLALSRSGIGHVAMLRDPGSVTPALPQPEPGTDEIATDPLTEAEEALTSGLSTIEAPTLDPGDVELALRYLANPTVIVVAEALDDGALQVAADAAAYAGASLIVIADGGAPPARALDEAIVLGAPVDDPDGVFARTVGAVAAAIDAGTDPRTALKDAIAASGWEPAEA